MNDTIKEENTQDIDLAAALLHAHQNFLATPYTNTSIASRKENQRALLIDSSGKSYDAAMYRDYFNFETGELDQERLLADTGINITKIIHRPNHGLPHTARVMTLMPVICEFFSKCGNDKGKELVGNMTHQEMQRLQLMAIFHVVGREDETGFHDKNKDGRKTYKGFRVKSAQAFYDYAKSKNIYQDEKSLLRDALILELMGNPTIPNEEDLMDSVFYHKFKDHLKLTDPNITFQQIKAEILGEGVVNGNSKLKILNLAHGLDLFRCYDKSLMRDTAKSILLYTNQSQYVNATELLRYAENLLMQTGNRIVTGVAPSQKCDQAIEMAISKWIEKKSYLQTSLENTKDAAQALEDAIKWNPDDDMLKNKLEDLNQQIKSIVMELAEVNRPSYLHGLIADMVLHDDQPSGYSHYFYNYANYTHLVACNDNRDYEADVNKIMFDLSHIQKPGFVERDQELLGVEFDYSFIKSVSEPASFSTFKHLVHGKESDITLRRSPQLPYTVRDGQVIERAKKLPQFSDTTKEGFTKPTATSVVFDDFQSAVFPYGNPQSKVGLIFDKDDALVNRFYLFNQLTARRTYDFLTEEQAEQFAKYSIPDFEIYLDELAKNFPNRIQEHPEVLARLRFNINTSAVAIFQDSLESRLLAQSYANMIRRELAAQQGVSVEAIQMPTIKFYLRHDKQKNMTIYDEKMQAQDAKQAEDLLADPSTREKIYKLHRFNLLLTPKNAQYVLGDKDIEGDPMIAELLSSNYAVAKYVWQLGNADAVDISASLKRMKAAHQIKLEVYLDSYIAAISAADQLDADDIVILSTLIDSDVFSEDQYHEKLMSIVLKTRNKDLFDKFVAVNPALSHYSQEQLDNLYRLADYTTFLAHDPVEFEKNLSGSNPYAIAHLLEIYEKIPNLDDYFSKIDNKASLYDYTFVSLESAKTTPAINDALRVLFNQMTQEEFVQIQKVYEFQPEMYARILEYLDPQDPKNTIIIQGCEDALRGYTFGMIEGTLDLNFIRHSSLPMLLRMVEIGEESPNFNNSSLSAILQFEITQKVTANCNDLDISTLIKTLDEFNHNNQKYSPNQKAAYYRAYIPVIAKQLSFISILNKTEPFSQYQQDIPNIDDVLKTFFANTYMTYRGAADSINHNEDFIQYSALIAVSLGWKDIPTEIFQQYSQDLLENSGFMYAPPAMREHCFKIWLEHQSRAKIAKPDSIQVHGMSALQYAAEQKYYTVLSEYSDSGEFDIDTELNNAVEKFGMFSEVYNNLLCFKENDFERESIEELFQTAKKNGDIDALASLVDKYQFDESTPIDSTGVTLEEYLRTVADNGKIFTATKASEQLDIRQR